MSHQRALTRCLQPAPEQGWGQSQRPDSDTGGHSCPVCRPQNFTSRSPGSLCYVFPSRIGTWGRLCSSWCESTLEPVLQGIHCNPSIPHLSFII